MGRTEICVQCWEQLWCLIPEVTGRICSDTSRLASFPEPMPPLPPLPGPIGHHFLPFSLMSSSLANPWLPGTFLVQI